ncbi:MAG TPA: hypothetical protein VI485_06250 [Vicinamibacterales bacterium]|nr:hypothetical protein [Vicinamibacterales bacterium]
MRALTVLLTLFLLCLAGAPAVAQEGHPLKGSWLGTWGPSKVHSNDILIIMNWDGKTITGMINPGTDNIPIKNATLNPEGWLVHIEAETKDKTGPIAYVIDGKIEGLAFHNRSVTGTWKSKTESGPFKISRQ